MRNDYKYVAIDVETNGLSSVKNEILEMCVVEFDEYGNIGEVITDKYRPVAGFITREITNINGISWDDVKDKPNYLSEGGREKMAKFIGDRIVVGHNIIKFDAKFIKIDFKETEDTLVMCRDMYSSRNNLKAACTREGIDWDDDKAHTAEFDTKKTVELFIKLKERIRKRDVKLSAPLFDTIPKSVASMGLNGVELSAYDKKLIATQAYSYSRISLFKQCKFKWYMQYIKGIKQTDSKPFMVGHMAHYIAELTGIWCNQTTFSNKVDAYVEKLTKEDSSKIFKTAKEFDPDFKSIGKLAIDNKEFIKKAFGFEGVGSMSLHLKDKLTLDDYETIAMPDVDTFNGFLDAAAIKFGCEDGAIMHEVKNIMRGFYKTKDFSLMPADMYITERKFAFDKDWVPTTFFGKDAYFRSVIDILEYFDDTIIITDYKSSRNMLKEKELPFDKQLQLYAMAIYKYFPRGSFKKLIVRIDYLRFGKVIAYEIPDIAEASDKAEAWLNEAIQDIESEMLKPNKEAFPPERNEYCHVCHIAGAGMCPLFDKRIINNIDDPENFVVGDMNDCVTAWKRIEANKFENTRLAAQCKAFVKNNEMPVVIDKKAILNTWVSEDVDYNALNLIKLLLKKGVKLQMLLKFCNINKAPADKLLTIAGVKLTDDELVKVTSKKTSTRFEACTSAEVKSKGYINR